ncbi:MAG: hypothetical protein WD206_09940 [Actinomycetota bacterium]
MKRPSGGRGEYEIAEAFGDAMPHDLLTKEMRIVVGRWGVRPTGVVLREQGGKPRLRIDHPGAVHMHRQVAASVLLPKSKRGEATLAGGFPIVFLNRYVLRRIHLTGLNLLPAQARVELGDMEAQNGTEDVQVMNFTDRVQRLEQVQDNLNLLPDPIAAVLTTHRGMLENPAPLTVAAEESVDHLMNLVQAQGPAAGIEYAYGTDVLPALEAMAGLVAPALPAPPALGAGVQLPPGPVGEEYRPADENAQIPQVDPFTVDPAIRERGLRGHAATQNALAEYVRGRDLEPKSPRPGDPNFDLAWEDGGSLFVAEVKSMTVANEEKQLRLGLGQVLRYRQVLARYDLKVTAVIAVEKRPEDHSWEELCTQVGVVLLWPDNMAEILDAIEGSAMP